jgi:hypothetical protein
VTAFASSNLDHTQTACHHDTSAADRRSKGDFQGTSRRNMAPHNVPHCTASTAGTAAVAAAAKKPPPLQHSIADSCATSVLGAKVMQALVSMHKTDP